MPQIYGERKFLLRRSPKKKGGYRKESQPIRKGKVVKVVILEISEKGDGVAKYDDFIVFVPNTKVGDTPWIKIVEVKKTNAIGKKLY